MRSAVSSCRCCGVFSCNSSSMSEPSWFRVKSSVQYSAQWLAASSFVCNRCRLCPLSQTCVGPLSRARLLPVCIPHGSVSPPHLLQSPDICSLTMLSCLLQMPFSPDFTGFSTYGFSPQIAISAASSVA